MVSDQGRLRGALTKEPPENGNWLAKAEHSRGLEGFPAPLQEVPTQASDNTGAVDAGRKITLWLGTPEAQGVGDVI